MNVRRRLASDRELLKTVRLNFERGRRGYWALGQGKKSRTGRLIIG